MTFGMAGALGLSETVVVWDFDVAREIGDVYRGVAFLSCFRKQEKNIERSVLPFD